MPGSHSPPGRQSNSSKTLVLISLLHPGPRRSPIPGEALANALSRPGPLPCSRDTAFWGWLCTIFICFLQNHPYRNHLWEHFSFTPITQLESSFSSKRGYVTSGGENCHFIPNTNTPTLPKLALWGWLTPPTQRARRILTRKITPQICPQMKRQKLWGWIPLCH